VQHPALKRVVQAVASRRRTQTAIAQTRNRNSKKSDRDPTYLRAGWSMRHILLGDTRCTQGLKDSRRLGLEPLERAVLVTETSRGRIRANPARSCGPGCLRNPSGRWLGADCAAVCQWSDGATRNSLSLSRERVGRGVVATMRKQDTPAYYIYLVLLCCSSSMAWMGSLIP
jgi:hypothetical protein